MPFVLVGELLITRKIHRSSWEIGVTPFRSMIEYLIDKNESRGIVLFYANKFPQDIAYKDIFNDAEKIGIRTVYTITKPTADWAEHTGRRDDAMIQKEIPDFLTRPFYISGPGKMVKNYHSMLREMGIAQKNIKIDYFPSF